MSSGPSFDLSQPDSLQRRYPAPPDLPWVVLLLLAGAINIFGEWLSRHTGVLLWRNLLSSEATMYAWLLVEASFVQQLQPESNVLFTSVSGGVLLAASFLLSRQGPEWLIAVLALSGGLMLLIDLFRMGRLLEQHYTVVEPYGLDLNRIWLFFFGPLYLQFHLARIAEWKRERESRPV